MKKHIVLVYFSLIVLICFSNTIAQERKITEQEMNSVGKNWTLKGKAYRLKKSGKSFDKKNGKITNVFEEVTEYDTLGNSHTIMEFGRTSEYLQRHEYFIIGKTSYDLPPSGKWRVGEVKPESEEQKARRISRQSKKETIAEHIYKGKILLKNQEADLYESKIIEKYKENGREFISIIITKKWYNKNGMLMKNEWTADNELHSFYRVFEIELDPSIKIEAPIK